MTANNFDHGKFPLVHCFFFLHAFFWVLIEIWENIHPGEGGDFFFLSTVLNSFPFILAQTCICQIQCTPDISTLKVPKARCRYKRNLYVIRRESFCSIFHKARGFLFLKRSKYTRFIKSSVTSLDLENRQMPSYPILKKLFCS